LPKALGEKKKTVKGRHIAKRNPLGEKDGDWEKKNKVCAAD